MSRSVGEELATALAGWTDGYLSAAVALEALTARAYPRRVNPAQGVNRPVSQGANPFSDLLATEALRSVGRFLVRAVDDASDNEARTEMMYAAMLAGIAFNASGCHLPHGLSYAVSGLAKDWHVPGYPEGKSLVPHGMAVVLNNPSVWRYTAACSPDRHLNAARSLGADARGASAADSGEVLAQRVVQLMRATSMPNGLKALGFDASHLDALATGAEPQYRVIKNAPKDVSRDDLKALFSAALTYW
jgi:alcohol dehydrogenase class IV